MHPLLGLLLCVRDHLPLPWREEDEEETQSYTLLSVQLLFSTGHRTLFKMFGVCRCFIFNYFHECWNWKSGVFTCALWLVKVCLILVFFANSLCIDFLMPNKCCSQSTWRIWSFSSSLTYFGETSRILLSSRCLCLSGPGGVGKWSKTQRGRLRQRLLCISLKGLQEHVMCLWKEKHFIKTASPSSVSLSLSLSSKSVATKALTIAHEVSHNQVSVSGRHHFSTEHWMKSKAQIMRSIWGKQMFPGNVYGEQQIFGETSNYIFFKANT